MNGILIRASPAVWKDAYVHILVFAGCLLMLANCSLFKNTATDLRKSHELSTAITQVKSAEQKDWLSKSGSVSFHQDSSDSGYSIQIWPKGTFSFSAEKGFSGEADKVVVTGKVKTGSLSSDLRSSTVQDKGKIQQRSLEKKKEESGQTQKNKISAPSWKWIIAVLAFLGVLGCFAYTKVKLIFSKLR